MLVLIWGVANRRFYLKSVSVVWCFQGNKRFVFFNFGHHTESSVFLCLSRLCHKMHKKRIRKKQIWFLADSLVIRLGLEPKTPTLKVLCSTCWANGSVIIHAPLYHGVWKSAAKLQCFFEIAKFFEAFFPIFFYSGRFFVRFPCLFRLIPVENPAFPPWRQCPYSVPLLVLHLQGREGLRTPQ